MTKKSCPRCWPGWKRARPIWWPATRYVEGGSAAGLEGKRGAISRLATKLTHRLVGTDLSDPMSGFFMMRRERLRGHRPRLSPVGFKILLDIVATAGERLRIAEQPYHFGERFDGESKFNAQIGVEFLGLLLAKMTGDLVDPRFIFFAIVGTLGLAVHLVALKLCLAFLPDQGIFDLFSQDQIIATFAAMTSNFLLNNELTYRDRRLKGLSALRGFVLFCLFCSPRGAGQCGFGVLALHQSRSLVAGRCGRRADGRGVELRHVRPVRLARAVSAPDRPAGAASLVACGWSFFFFWRRAP